MRKIIIYIGGVILSLLVFSVTFANFGDWFLWCASWGYGMMWYWFFYFLIFLLIVISLIMIFNKNTNSEKMMWKSDTNLSILKKRLANGEITEKEFDAMKIKLNEK